MTLQIECFPMTRRPPDIVPGRPQRAWMEAFADRHPYRCLPLTMANTTGWEVLCPVGFTAEWNGGLHQSDIAITPDHPFPDFGDFAKSHFSHGVLTLHTGYMFRTPEGWSMSVGGAPNHIKDGIQPLVGVVETDWLPFPFTMNWRFTRPGRVKFARGEPFCFLMPIQDKALEGFELVQKALDRDVELSGQYNAWRDRREEFNKRIHRQDPEAMREAWQRFYFKGEMPDDAGEAPRAHVNKRRLKPLKLGR
jgi:hypothetical protein